MNERIKELAQQAHFHSDQIWLDQDRFEKFAQLMVKECGVALSPMLRDMVSRGQAYDLIKQHFGVKE